MNPTDIFIIIIIAIILALAGFYVYRAKKSGKKCIGCPDSGSCSSGEHTCSGSCSSCNGSCGKKQ